MKQIASLILYPVQASNITVKQKEYITEIFNDLDLDELENILKNKIKKEQLKEIADSISEDERLNYFKLAKTIAEIDNISYEQYQSFAELGLALGIKETETGFSFNIYDKEELRNFEYKRTLTNYSMISAAIGFIPFIPISDFFILTTLQLGLISKIANLYNFKIDGDQFLKMIVATLGSGFIFRTAAGILNRFIPIVGWVINASIAFAGTYAIGIITKRYIEANGDLSEDSIKTIWENSFSDGKEEFSKFKDFILDKKDDLLKTFNETQKKQNTKDDDIDEEEDTEKEEKKKHHKKKSKKKTKTEDETYDVDEDDA